MKLLTTAILSVATTATLAQESIDFERGEISNVKSSRGQVSISDDHRVVGKSSLRWDFAPNDTLTIYKPIGFYHQTSKSVSLLGKEYKELVGDPVGFNLPVYSPERRDSKMRIAFGRDGVIDCYTDVLLDYASWYRFTMPYDRGQMKGAPRTDMTQVQFINMSDESGTLYFDDLNTSVEIGQRFIAPYYLMPDAPLHTQRKSSAAMVNDETYLNRAWFPLNPVTAEEREGLQTIEDRLFELEWGGRDKIAKVRDAVMDKIRKQYNSYNITVKDGIINGDHVTTNGNYNNLIKSIGVNFYKTNDEAQKRELAMMGVNMLWHAADVANFKIAWYNGRGAADGSYLLREELDKAGCYDKVLHYLRTAYSFDELYDEDRVWGTENLKGISTDDLYTNSISKIVCALMVRDPEQRVRDLRHMISFYDNVAFKYSPGLTDAFKPDGSLYHHANVLADRYSYYTMPVTCELFRIMSKTTFAFSEESHNTIRENLKGREFFRSENYVPWAYMHYGLRSSAKLLPTEFLHMALAGSMDGEPIDKEMGAIYLRLMGNDPLPEDAEALIEAGVKASDTPQGHKTMSYYAKGIYRWQDWLVITGAHSRYIYPTEIWRNNAGGGRGNTVYNPFVNWGQLELILPDREDMSFVNNGWDIDGWDYTRIPGTTTVKAPLDSLRTVVMKNGDDEDEHLRSDQSFVGGVDCSDGNGVFVAKIRGHEKYNMESFYATKSFFTFGDVVLCLGSGIENQLPYYNTQTTLFQNAMKFNPFALNINGRKLSDKRYIKQRLEAGDNWMIDSRGVGYYVPEGDIEVRYQEQTFRNVTDTEDKSGVFESAWIDHGAAPFEAGYEYMIKLATDAREMKSLSQNHSTKYNVVRRDEKAHIVEFPEYSSCAMVLYEKNYDLNQGVVKGITHSAVVVAKQQDGKLTLSISDPDLRFYQGHSSDLDLFGRRHEQPTYSNFWHNNESIPSKIKVFLNGDWSVEEVVKRGGEVIQQANGVTVVEFECQHGLTNEIVLTSAK